MKQAIEVLNCKQMRKKKEIRNKLNIQKLNDMDEDHIISVIFTTYIQYKI